MKKDTLKESLSLQLTSGKIPQLRDSKLYNSSLSRKGKREKDKMSEPTESVIIQVQQNFDIDGGLNPLKIELEDDRIINILKSINMLDIDYRCWSFYFQHL